MHPIRILLFKALIRFFRNRTVVSMTFIMPIVLIYIFGWVFGLNKKDAGPTGIKLAVVNASTNPAAEKLVDALKAEKAFRVVTKFDRPDGTSRPLVEADLRPMIRDREFRFAVVIPLDVIPSSGFGLHLKILSDPRNEIETKTVDGLLQKTIFSSVPELLGQSLQARAKELLGGPRLQQFDTTMSHLIATTFGGDEPEILQQIVSGQFGLQRLAQPAKPVDPSLRRLDATPALLGSTDGKEAPQETAATKKAVDDFFARIVRIESEQIVGKDVKSPEATRIVGGFAIMFLLFAITGAATSLFEEKTRGIFQRLLAAPVTRADILWSRFLFGVLLGLVQLVTLFCAGRVLYGIDVFGHIVNLVIVCTAAAAACTGIGMLIASLSSTQEAAMGISTFVVLTMSACGGAWFPVSFMPEFMQHIARFTLVYWSMEGFSQVLWAGDTLVQLLPTLGILSAITAGSMAIAVWGFNRNQIFD